MTETNQTLLSRERVNRELQNIFTHPLTIVSAPMGYGKTTAVRDFLRRHETEQVWVRLAAGDGTAGFFWDRLAAQLGDKKEELGQALKSLGFPADAPQRAKILDLFCDEEFDTPFVIVLDDYHLVTDQEAFELISLIVRQEIHNLHFVVIAREVHSLNISGLTRLCTTVTIEKLRFRRDEVRQYFHMMRIAADEKMIDAVTEHTEGWIAMIYLISLGIKDGQSMRNVDSVGELVEHNLFRPCDDETKDILRRLSLMDFFSAKQAEYALEREDMDEVLRRMRSQNAFITCHENERVYKIHHVLLDFLRERKPLPEAERQKIYRRLADWHMHQKEYLSAFLYYQKAEEPELVFSALNTMSPPSLPYSQFLSIMGLFAVQPAELCVRYPLAFLHYSAMLLISGEGTLAARGAEILARLKIHFENNSEVHKNLRDFILGEIHVCGIFANFNDVDAMSFHVREAKRLFDGACSLVSPRKSEFTFGSPHFLYTYYRTPGEFKATAEKLAAGFAGFADIADGCGSGCDYLAAAEYALETLDPDTADLNAFKAMYKANAKEQVCVAACACFTLIRLNLFKGKQNEAFGFLSQLTEEIVRENNPVLNTTLDLIVGYMYGLLGTKDKIPQWLRDGDMSPASFIYQGLAWNYIVYGKALLLQGDYIKLDVFCEDHAVCFDTFQNRLGHLHNYIHRAAAKLHTEGEAAAAAQLQKALAIGQADHIILPFAENCQYILPVLQTMRKDGNNDLDRQYLQRVTEACIQYNQNNLVRGHDGAILSARETEILLLLREGLRREEIASRLVVSPLTVKTHTANLYRKLGVGNRSAAVKKASDLGLI